MSGEAREALGEIGETLAWALHHQNIGRETRGWSEVSEAFDSVKSMPALAAYADSCESEYPLLAADLRRISALLP